MKCSNNFDCGENQCTQHNVKTALIQAHNYMHACLCTHVYVHMQVCVYAYNVRYVYLFTEESITHDQFAEHFKLQSTLQYLSGGTSVGDLPLPKVRIHR